MAYSGITAPNNVIVAHGIPPLIFTRKIQLGSAYTVPGAGVENGDSVGEVIPWSAGETEPLGWIGYEQCPAESIDGHTRATAFATDDEVAILAGGGFVVMANLATGETVVAGDYAQAADNGEVALADSATVTIASGSATVKSDKAQPDEAVAGTLPAGGGIVGQFREGSSGGELVMLQSRI